MKRLALVVFGMLFAGGLGETAFGLPPLPPPGQPPASPDQMKLAESFWERGAAAYSNGDYPTAITLWNQSYAISHEPKLQQQLALAYGHLGKAKEERAALQAYRPFAPAVEQSRIDEQLKNLDERIAQQDKDDKARADEDARLKAQLEYERTHPRGASGPVVSIPGVIVGTVGVGAVVAGVVVDGVASSVRPDAAKVCRVVGTDQICLQSAQSDITRGNRMAIGGDVTWIVGAAAIATGVVIIIIDRPKPKAQPPAPIQPLAPPPTRDHARVLIPAELEIAPFDAVDAGGRGAPGLAIVGTFE
jgi:hypothetical protein